MHQETSDITNAFLPSALSYSLHHLQRDRFYPYCIWKYSRTTFASLWYWQRIVKNISQSTRIQCLAFFFLSQITFCYMIETLPLKGHNTPTQSTARDKLIIVHPFNPCIAWKYCLFDEIVVTSYNESCQNDNFHADVWSHPNHCPVPPSTPPYSPKGHGPSHVWQDSLHVLVDGNQKQRITLRSVKKKLQ